MKKKFFSWLPVFFFVAAVCVGFASCGGSDDDDDVEVGGQNQNLEGDWYGTPSAGSDYLVCSIAGNVISLNIGNESTYSGTFSYSGSPQSGTLSVSWTYLGGGTETIQVADVTGSSMEMTVRDITYRCTHKASDLFNGSDDNDNYQESKRTLQWVTCSRCKGTGKCNLCGGTGETKIECGPCHGTGVSVYPQGRTCSYCDGKGYTSVKCYTCVNTGGNCIICNGAGGSYEYVYE